MLATDKLDMASARESLPTFSGTDVEDIGQWIKQAHVIQHLTQLPDETILSVAALKLRGTAQKRFCDLLARQPELTLHNFLGECNARFCNPQKIHALLEKFLNGGTATSKE
ncbi:hypothetical protein COBT_002684, partial [Conglomerata obtusa]